MGHHMTLTCAEGNPGAMKQVCTITSCTAAKAATRSLKPSSIVIQHGNIADENIDVNTTQKHNYLTSPDSFVEHDQAEQFS